MVKNRPIGLFTISMMELYIQLFLKQIFAKKLPVKPDLCVFQVFIYSSCVWLVNIFILDTATYINSSNYELNGKQILGDTWSIESGNALQYQTYARENCMPLKTEYIDNQYGKIWFY